MEIFRKISLGLCCAAFAVCGLFMNLVGGLGMYVNNYKKAGLCLMLSTAALLISIVAAFFRKTPANIISVIFNIAGTLLYVYPIGILNGIPNNVVSAESIEKFTSRIYPSVIVTVLLGAAVFADFFSYDRISARSAKKEKKKAERSRALKDSEKIV